ncbi:conjugative transposon protein TraJ [Chitinophaga sp. Ak27]|uniref:conjugative transposon protein TraJ n=1 Tax=Chitinophaga sp. Ak27 TaxID=2726116 RepID=UPI00145FC5AA|nr:conjugative transposon protein TraJ [Chitinophaga sp. Ak27]NLU91379.1 conjugative transposon protein TraJ [Chitinophaga sp. Ak27]
MKYCVGAGVLLLAVYFPFFSQAQGIAGDIKSFQSVLETLYKDMLPKVGSLINVGRAVAGFAAIWYIAYRVWGHIARAESIDFYPLFRPFALGLAITLFPQVLAVMNGALNPIVTGTAQLVDNSDKAIAELFKKKEVEMRKSDQWKALVGESGAGDRSLWMEYTHPDVKQEGWVEKIGNSMEFVMAKIAYNFTNDIKRIISIILQIVYAAAALCINTLRTFNLIILAMLGPLVLGISVFDGFQHTLNMYLARYINIYLWLPVANILGAVLGTIQENILKMDLKNLAETGTTFFSTYDLGYIIFMLIGIIAYTTVPSIADQIVHVGGGGALQQKATQSFGSMAFGGPAAVATGKVSL